MKKIKVLKPALLLFTVLTFSMCKESEPTQFEVVKDFETSVVIQGLNGQSSYSEEIYINVSDLLNNATNFVTTDIESITIKLEDDYSGPPIKGTIKVSIGSNSLFNKKLTLSSIPTNPIEISSDVSDIFSAISSGDSPSLPVTITIDSESPIEDEDNNFSVKFTFEIKAIVEQ